MSDYRSIYEDIEKSKETPMNDFLDDAIKRVQKEFVDNHNVIKIPKPGSKVSFPVACVTGVCFKITPTSYVFRWNTGCNRLDKWDTWNPDEGKQERTFRWWPYKQAGPLDWFYDTVTVVDEPKMPEPVWKDCNFIEAVEWMKKSATHTARWEGEEYYMFFSSGTIRRKRDGARLYDVAGGREGNYILGKWEIKVEG